MHQRSAEQGKKYFQELTLNLRREGFTTGDEADGLLPVKLDGQQLCSATSSGGIRYWQEDITSKRMSKAMERVTDIAKITDSRRELLESACKQIEDVVPDLDERVDQSNLDELDLADPRQSQGMEQSW